jgi:hypothetical protein
VSTAPMTVSVSFMSRCAGTAGSSYTTKAHRSVRAVLRPWRGAHRGG